MSGQKICWVVEIPFESITVLREAGIKYGKIY